MSNEINSSDDTLNSCDIIARIEELETDISGWEDDIEEHENEVIAFEGEIEDKENEASDLDDNKNHKNGDEISELENNIDSLQSEIINVQSNIGTLEADIREAKEELTPLESLASDGEDYAPDWTYGATLINEDYFTEYCKDMVSDIGDLPSQLPPYIEDNINWDGVAEDLKVDYSEIVFDGETFFVR